jgi:dTDP-glucose pyrophosphorylase
MSNAMIPVNGRPVIAWILEDLLSKEIDQATVVVREGDQSLRSFLERAYVDRMEVQLCVAKHAGTIVQSLQAGLACAGIDGLVRIILGDTLIQDSFKGEQDFVYTGPVAGGSRWCLAVTDERGYVTDYIDKQEAVDGTHDAVAGYYHLWHGDFLWDCVQQTVETGEIDLSDVLRRYGERYPITSRAVKSWYDFGHIDNLVDARRRLLRPRHFNTVTVDPILNTITKVSDDHQKLRDELNWYLLLPDELKVLTPRILSHREVNGRLEIVQEYYGYPTLGELYVYGELHAETWLSILRHVTRIHQEFRRYPGQVRPEHTKGMYLDKTWRRLAELREQDPRWRHLLEADKIVFNDIPLRNIAALRDVLVRRSELLSENAPVSIIHGDYCFSNILFDVNNQIIRLIDPRGSFGRKGIYGDARYDMAKLRHSVCGLYDFLVSDMFDLKEVGLEFVGQVYTDGIPESVASPFDEMLVEAGYVVEDIKFIEGLLFLSMLPLHHGHPLRQRMMYLTGLSLLNEVL